MKSFRVSISKLKVNVVIACSGSSSHFDKVFLLSRHPSNRHEFRTLFFPFLRLTQRTGRGFGETLRPFLLVQCRTVAGGCRHSCCLREDCREVFTLQNPSNSPGLPHSLRPSKCSTSLHLQASSFMHRPGLFPRAVEVLEEQEEIRTEWTKGGELWPCSFRSTNFSSSPSSICTRRNVLYHRENDIDSRPTPLDEAIGLEYSRALPPFTTHNSRRRQVWAIFGERLAKRRFGAYVQFPCPFRARQ